MVETAWSCPENHSQTVGRTVSVNEIPLRGESFIEGGRRYLADRAKEGPFAAPQERGGPKEERFSRTSEEGGPSDAYSVGVIFRQERGCIVRY